MKAYNTIDAVLPNSFLRRLQFEEFISLLNHETRAEFFTLPFLIATALTWLHDDEMGKIDTKLLMMSVRSCVVQRLFKSREGDRTMSISGMTGPKSHHQMSLNPNDSQ